MKPGTSGSAAKTFLPVLIAVPLALVAGYAARSQVRTAPPAATHRESEKPVAIASRQPATSAPSSAPADRIAPLGETAAAAPIAPLRPDPLPAPPPAALERTVELRQWLLALPNTDIARLSGTAEMDAYVCRIVGDLQATAVENPDAVHDLDRFLKEINAAILRAKSEK